MNLPDRANKQFADAVHGSSHSSAPDANERLLNVARPFLRSRKPDRQLYPAWQKRKCGGISTDRGSAQRLSLGHRSDVLPLVGTEFGRKGSTSSTGIELNGLVQQVKQLLAAGIDIELIQKLLRNFGGQRD